MIYSGILCIKALGYGIEQFELVDFSYHVGGHLENVYSLEPF